MNKASTAQKRKIFLLARERDMDNDLLHSYIYALVHKDSIRKLSIMEAVKVIDGLSGRETRSSSPKSDHMSSRQKKYIEDLAVKMGWVTEDGTLDQKRLSAFCWQFGTESWTWMSRSQACKVIEALKDWVKRLDGRGQDGEGA